MHRAKRTQKKHTHTFIKWQNSKPSKKCFFYTPCRNRAREKAKVERWIIFSLCRSTWTNTQSTLQHCYWTQAWHAHARTPPHTHTTHTHAHTHTHTHNTGSVFMLTQQTDPHFHKHMGLSHTKSQRTACEGHGRTADLHTLKLQSHINCSKSHKIWTKPERITPETVDLPVGDSELPGPALLCFFFLIFAVSASNDAYYTLAKKKKKFTRALQTVSVIPIGWLYIVGSLICFYIFCSYFELVKILCLLIIFIVFFSTMLFFSVFSVNYCTSA